MNNKLLSIVLPTYNERENIQIVLNKIFQLASDYSLEILIVDDNSTDGTSEIVKSLAKKDSRIRLIRRVGRSGLSSAIKEGLLNATSDIAVVMDADGQHQPVDVFFAVKELIQSKADLVVGSRFLDQARIRGLSERRAIGSNSANTLARISLSNSYQNLTDYMSGCFALNLKTCIPFILKINVNGFKFYYELLSLSKGSLKVKEVPLVFESRFYGQSKLDLSVIWDFIISLLHTLTFRVLPRRAISFGLVGLSGVIVQLISTNTIMYLFFFSFERALPISILVAATSNYLINNALTFRSQRLFGYSLFKGLTKFLLVSSLPVMANIGLATAFYNSVYQNTLLAQISGICVVFIWNYVASSRFVWNSP
tara:strand:- start:3821 stop:4921 length:1101 start_codon:yes stop_codon:yes gene_type:complete